MICRVVLLPEPFSPMMQKTSPRRMAKLKSLSGVEVAMVTTPAEGQRAP